MDIGVVLQTTPPSARVIDLAKRAESYGFSHVWTFDSHILWEEPFPIFTQILANTRNVVVGPMVTNPITRDWTVTASVFATLNEMFGNRTVIGIGRGDSAVRVLNGKPSTLAALREAIHVIRELSNGREAEYRGSTLRFPWASKSRVEVWGAGYGPKALQVIGEVADGFILQLADPDIAAWTITAVRKAASDAGRDPAELTICVAAPAYVTDDVAYARDQCRWFGGMVGNHVADIVARYGESSEIPAALTDYIKGREGYDYNQHGQAGNVHAQFVPDEIVDRFCILGGVEEHVRRLEELRDLGRGSVRGLPATRRQGRDASPLRREGHPRDRGKRAREVVSRRSTRAVATPERVRRVWMFLLALAAVALLWELYKLIGPAGRRHAVRDDAPAARERHRDAARLGDAVALRGAGAPGRRGVDLPHRRWPGRGSRSAWRWPGSSWAWPSAWRSPC